MNRLEVRHLGTSFDTDEGRVRAVVDVSFAIRAGATTALVGESGSGKSTIGRTVLRPLECTGRQVLYRGEDIGRLSSAALRRLRSKLQIIFQDPYASLNPKMRIGAVLGEALATHGLHQGKGAQDRRIAGLLQPVGLRPGHAERYPHEFSGGQCRRIGIARAGGRARVHRRRRAAVGAGRVDPGAGDQPAGRPARTPGADDALHLARPRRRRVPVRPRGRALPRPRDGDRPHGRAVRAAAAPVHARLAGVEPEARPAGRKRCGAAAGRHPEPGGSALSRPTLDEWRPGCFSACHRKDLLLSAKP